MKNITVVYKYLNDEKFQSDILNWKQVQRVAQLKQIESHYINRKAPTTLTNNDEIYETGAYSYFILGQHTTKR